MCDSNTLQKRQYILAHESKLLACGVCSVNIRAHDVSIRNYALECENIMIKNVNDQKKFKDSFQNEKIAQHYMALVKQRIKNSTLWDLKSTKMIIYPPLFLPVAFENAIIRYNSFIIMMFKEGVAMPILIDPTNKHDADRIKETIKLYENDLLLVQ